MKEHKPLLKKQVITIFSFAIAVFALSFSFAFLYQPLRNAGLSESTTTAITVGGFLVFGIISVSILLANYGAIYEYEVRKEEAKMQAIPLQTISCELDSWKVRRILQSKNFVLYDNNVFHLKQASVWHEFVNYYVIQVQSENVDESIETLIDKINDVITVKNEKPTKNNAILFISYVDYPKEEDFKALKDFVINQRIVQTIPQAMTDAIVPIIIDLNNQAHYAFYSKGSLRMYDFTLKQYFKLLGLHNNNF